MNDTQDRIMAWTDDGENEWVSVPDAEFVPRDAIEYIRADLVPRWQPIETAPKDGSFVLLRGGRFYCEERHGTVEVPQVASWVKDGRHGDWLIVGFDDGHVWANYKDPTQWIPLFDLPEATE